MDYEALGKRVRAYRKLFDMTQEELAEAVGVSCSFVGHIERGTRKLSVDTLVRLADVLQVSCDTLLQDSLSCPAARPSARSETRKLLLREIVSLLENEEDL